MPADRPVAATAMRSVLRNAAFGVAGQVLIKLFTFAFSVYVVRRLGDAHYGRYAATLAYVGSLAMLTDLGTSAFALREIAHQVETARWMVADLRLVRGMLSGIVIVAITLAAWVSGRPPDMVLGVFLASWALLLYAFQGPLNVAMIAAERLDLCAAVNLLNQLVFVALGSVALLSGAGYVGLLVASLAGVLAMTVASQLLARRVLAVRFERPDPRRWKPLLRASLPFGVAAATNEFARRFDTVFMSFALSDAAVGWYSAPFNLIMGPLLLAQNLALALQPALVREYDAQRGVIGHSVQRAVRYVLLVSLPLAVGGAVLADHVVIVLYGPAFAPAIPVMRILVWLLPPLFLAEIFGRAASTLHLERQMMRVSLLCAIGSVSLVVVCVLGFGVIGAAVAVLAGQVVTLILTGATIGRDTLWHDNRQPLLRVAVAAAIMGGVLLVLRYRSFAALGDGKLFLLVAVGVGVVTYVLAAVVLGAVAPQEVQALASSLLGSQRRSDSAGPPQM